MNHSGSPSGSLNAYRSYIFSSIFLFESFEVTISVARASCSGVSGNCSRFRFSSFSYGFVLERKNSRGITFLLDNLSSLRSGMTPILCSISLSCCRAASSSESESSSELSSEVSSTSSPNPTYHPLDKSNLAPTYPDQLPYFLPLRLFALSSAS